VNLFYDPGLGRLVEGTTNQFAPGAGPDADLPQPPRLRSLLLRSVLVGCLISGPIFFILGAAAMWAVLR